MFSTIYNKCYTAEINKEVINTINCNTLIRETISKYDLNLIDLFQITARHDGFSNGLFHIDNRHLSCDAIGKIEKQITIQSTI